MKTVIATTTGFHLRRLAAELSAEGEDVQYYSGVPSFRMRREGLDPRWAHSLFAGLLPTSAVALMRGTPWQMSAVESMLAKTDDRLVRRLPASDVFIGLSSMAVRSAARARDLGATVVIERGSRHVLSQERLLSQGGGAQLSQFYIDRELASYEQADFITVPSTHAAESFIQEGFAKDRIFTCPLGVDLRQFAPTPRPKGRLRILFVGGWSYQKGVDVLVEAMAKRPDWHLTHVGTMAGAEFPGARLRITSLGHKSHAELSKIMAEHHMLVLPSRQDGFGMVLLEALAAGLPVVASNMTGGPDIRDTLEDAQWVETFVPGDVEDLVLAIDRMARRESASRSRAPRRRLSQRDLDFYSWAGYGKRYLKFLSEIAQQRGGTP